jgi:hypothetical protein
MGGNGNAGFDNFEVMAPVTEIKNGPDESWGYQNY